MPLIWKAFWLTHEWVAYSDAATETLALQPSSTDAADFADAATAVLTFSISGTDIQAKEYSDANTEYLRFVRVNYVDYAPLTLGIDWDQWILSQLGYYSTGWDFGSITFEVAYANSFIPSSQQVHITGIDVWLSKLGSPTDNVSIQIQSDSGSLPSGTVLASGIIPGSSIPVRDNPNYYNYSRFHVPLDLVLTAGTKYWIVWTRDGSRDDSNYYFTAAPAAEDKISAVNLTSATFAYNSTGWQLGSPARDLFFVLEFDYDTSSLPFLTLTPSSLDIESYVETNTEALLLIPSSADIAQYVEVNTETLGFVPSAIEKSAFVENVLIGLEVVPASINLIGLNNDTSAGSPRRETAQQFTSPGSYLLQEIELFGLRTGSPTDNLQVDIVNDNAGLPTGSVLGSGTVPAASISSVGSDWFLIPFPTVISLTAGQQYWIVVYRTGSTDNSNYINIAEATSDIYIGNNTKFLNFTSWVNDSGDLAFRADFSFAGTALLALAPSSTDTAQFVDANTESLTLIPSTTTEEHTTYDAATESLLFVPSSADVADFIDSNTKSLALKPSSSDIALFVDTPSDIYVPDIYPQQFIAYSDINWYAQSFIPSSNSLLRSIQLILYNAGAPSPGNTIIELRNDNSNKPGSTILASLTVTNLDIPAANTLLTLGVASDISVNGGTRYWIVVHGVGSDGGMRWKYTGKDVLANSGLAVDGFNSGATWTVTALDLLFGVKFDPEPTDVNFGLKPSSTDIEDSVETNTEILALTGNSSEAYGTEDTATEGLLLAPSASDILQAQDAASELFSLAPSDTQNFQGTDSDAEKLLLAPSSQDIADYVDSDTESLVLASSSSDTAQLLDSQTEILALVPSIQEEHTTYDADTERLALVPTSQDIAQFIDVNTESLILSPSGSDIYTAGGGGTSYNDADSKYLILTPQADDSIGHSDVDTEHIVFTPSADIAEGLTDESTAAIRTTPIPSDIAEFIDAAAKRIAFDILSTESYGRQDAATITIEFVTFADETHIITDAQQEVLILSSPGTVEYAEFVDSGTLYLKLVPKALEVLKLYELVGIAFKRFQALAIEMRWSGAGAKRFWSKAREMRWSATIPFKRWWFKSQM